MASWKKIALETTDVVFSGLNLTNLSAQSNEFTVLSINGSDIVGTVELGTLAFSSATIPAAANNSTVTITAGGGLVIGAGGDSSFTLDQAGDAAINLDVNTDDTTITIIEDEIAVKAAGISEVHLNATNTPTDNYLLTYDSASAGFTWVAPAAAPNDATITIGAGDGLTGGGSFTVNQSGNEVITLNVSGLTIGEFSLSTIVVEAEGIASNDNDTTLPTSAAVIDYVTDQISGVDLTTSLSDGNNSGSVSTSGTLTIQGTDDEVEVQVSGSTFTVGLPNDVIIAGNLTVNGTTTTINSTELSVDDKNITLASTASPSSATANGGGITLATGDATADPSIQWNSSGSLGGFEVIKKGTSAAAGFLSLMQFGTATPTAAPAAGDGTFYMDTDSDALYVYLA